MDMAADYSDKGSFLCDPGFHELCKVKVINSERLCTNCITYSDVRLHELNCLSSHVRDVSLQLLASKAFLILILCLHVGLQVSAF